MALSGGYAKVALAAILCSAPLALAAQDGPGGASAELSFTERLLWEDGETSLRSDLGLAYSSQTRSQRFSFDGFASLDKLRSDGEAADVVDPRVSLTYGLENRNTALDFALRYRSTDVSSLVLDEGLDVPALVLDDGTRTNLSARLGLELGREAPFGASLSLGYASTEYTDTTSALLLDSQTLDGTLRLRFDIDQRISSHITLTASDLDRDGGTDVRRETLSFGATMAVNQALDAEIDIGTTRVTQDGAIPRQVDEGMFYSLGLTRTLTNGTLAGTLVSDLNENGRRTTLQVTRAMDLPNGALRFGAGLSQNDTTNSDVRPLVNLAYTRDLPRGRIDIDFSQNFGSDSVGNETLNSALQLRLQQDLTARDRLSARVGLRRADRSGGALDTRSVDFGVDYARDLTSDWAFVSGYTHTRRTDSGGGEEIDDTFFVGLRTSLAWRP